MSIFKFMQDRHSELSREAGQLDAKIACEKITNPAHVLCKKLERVEAQISLLGELMVEELNIRQAERYETLNKIEP